VPRFHCFVGILADTN